MPTTQHAEGQSLWNWNSLELEKNGFQSMAVREIGWLPC
jgi:hypothetical protein